jgi:uncharacterized protein YjbI with pentapeptide repeats
MKNQLQNFVDQAFHPYGDFPAQADVKQELLSNLEEKYDDFIKASKTEREAYQLTVDSVGDIAEMMEHIPHSATGPYVPAEPVQLSGMDLAGADLAGTALIKSKLNGSSLKDADFQNADLSGTNFRGSDLNGAHFDGANLTDSKIFASSLDGVTFKGTNLTNAEIKACSLGKTVFESTNFTGTKISVSDLKGAQFTGGCTLQSTNFNKSDLTGASFDGQTLTGVIFFASLKNATFNGAVLRGVSFHRDAAKHANFAGATMDKITYAVLKNRSKANLDGITLIA